MTDQELVSIKKGQQTNTTNLFVNSLLFEKQ